MSKLKWESWALMGPHQAAASDRWWEGGSVTAAGPITAGLLSQRTIWVVGKAFNREGGGGQGLIA